MAEDVKRVHVPSSGVLCWLVDPGLQITSDMREMLLSRMFSGAIVIVMGAATSMILSSVALAMHCGSIFGVYVAADVILAIFRVHLIRAANRAIENRCVPTVDVYLLSGILWSALQGMIAFTALQTHDIALQLLSAIQIFGIIGPICARNFPAPRYCLVLVCLGDLPFVAGCVFSGNHWLLVTLLETPFFLLGVYQVIKNFQVLAMKSLKGELESQHRAMHDPLTGLLNRGGLSDAITQMSQTAMASVALIALDLDGFKKVNDTLGHHVGDALLKAVADRLAARVRPTDLVIRLGGDEFLVVAKEIQPSAAARLCDRIIDDITTTAYLIESAPPVNIGVSIGFACGPDDGTSIEMLHRRADAALYAAKAGGKGVHRRHPSCIDDKEGSVSAAA